jgi:hypothetical protein
MDLEHEFNDVRISATNRMGVVSLTRTQRGYRVGMITEYLEGAATAENLEFEGQLRKARLKLASDIYNREITSYNDLKDHELDALYGWAIGHGMELRAWLTKTYGTQMTFQM